MFTIDLLIIDNDLSRFFRRHTIIEDPTHPYVLKKMISWIEHCNVLHPKCSSSQNFVPLPTRLLDLSSLPSQNDIVRLENNPQELFRDESIKLVDTSTSQGRYIALSYCWGKGVPYTTTSENIEEHKKKGVLYRKLPKTLQDAVFLTRLLGHQYLWVDCLCIVQDDENDWEYEAAQMGIIYSRAFVTIIAARAYDCDQGFLQSRSACKETRRMRYVDKKGPFELQYEYDDLQGSPSTLIAETDHPLRLHGVCSFANTIVQILTLHSLSLL